jgi:lysine biosynthesis protein LysW
MAFAYCPDCSARIYLGHKPWVGQPATCDHCESDLEVVQVNPPILDWTDGELEDPLETEEDELASIHVEV